MCWFKESLKNLNPDSLSTIIKKLWEEGKIFQSEAQFQFTLAWKLKEHFDCEVKLEDLTVIIDGKQKIYTDIVLVKKDYRVAIELKYKTAPLKYGDTTLFDDGAADVGRYDFLWDVNRIELLVNPSAKIPIECEINKNVLGKIILPEAYKVQEKYEKGYAIILTNEEKYWNKCWVDETIGVHFTIDNRFSIGAQKEESQLFSNTLDWKHISTAPYPECYPKTARVPLSRARPITLFQAYKYKWEKYCSIIPSNPKDSGEFKFLIISVENS